MTQSDAEKFVQWLLRRVVSDATGESASEQETAPRGRFWLGRLASEEAVRNRGLGERGERLDPCEIGIRVLRSEGSSGPIQCKATVVFWRKVVIEGEGGPRAIWRKSTPVAVTASLEAPSAAGDPTTAGKEEFQGAFAALGVSELSAEFRAEI